MLIVKFVDRYILSFNDISNCFKALGTVATTSVRRREGGPGSPKKTEKHTKKRQKLFKY